MMVVVSHGKDAKAYHKPCYIDYIGSFGVKRTRLATSCGMDSIIWALVQHELDDIKHIYRPCKRCWKDKK